MMITMRVVEDSDGGPVNYEATVMCPVCQEKLKVCYRSYKRNYKTGSQSTGTKRWYPFGFERHLTLHLTGNSTEKKERRI